jgi:DNA processing protein
MSPMWNVTGNRTGVLTRLDSIAWSLACAERDASAPRRGRPVTTDVSLDLPFADDTASFPTDVSLEGRLLASGEPPDLVPLRAAELRASAAALLERAGRAGISACTPGDDVYPVVLATIPDPPLALWSAGDLRPDDHAIAIVGSRGATPHALEVAFQLGAGLARAGVTVVSGLARGVDGAAHRGALDGGGRTLAVMGSGADVVYPPEHVDLARRITRSGAIVSEFVPGTPPLPWHFPRRNRIISGLCAGVVVVEAAARSGSLHTARFALNQGREVMAVPGGVLSGRNRGAHALLRDGATIVETADDVLEAIHYVGAPAFMGGDRPRGRQAPDDSILRAMQAGEPYDVAFLAERTAMEPVRVLSRLAELELGGWVCRAGGGRFVRPGSNVLR